MEDKLECTDCEYTTVKNRNLKEHFRRNHGSGKNKHTCDLCNFATFNKSKLKLHKQNKHEEDCQQRYVCDQCDYLCLKMKELKRHKKNFHNVTLKSARSSFTLFLQEERKKCLDNGDVLSSKEMIEKAKLVWKTLGEPEKSKYKDAARLEYRTWYASIRPKTSTLDKILEEESTDESEGESDGTDCCTEYEFRIDSTEVHCGEDSRVQYIKTRRSFDIGNKIIVTPEEIDRIPIVNLEDLDPVPGELAAPSGQLADQCAGLVTIQLPVTDLAEFVFADNQEDLVGQLSADYSLASTLEPISVQFKSPPIAPTLNIQTALPSSVLPNSEYSLSVDHNLIDENVLNADDKKKSKKVKPLHSCDVCDFKTVKRSNLSRHVKTQHTDFKLKCDVCDFTTPHDGSLKKHIKSHGNQRKKELPTITKLKKRKPASFLIFSKENRSIVKNDLSTPGTILNSREINRELGRRWRNLDPSQREEFKIKSGFKAVSAAATDKLPKNAYNCFMKDCVRELKKDGSKPSSKELFLCAGQKWKQLSEEDKKKYYKIYFEKRKNSVG